MSRVGSGEFRGSTPRRHFRRGWEWVCLAGLMIGLGVGCRTAPGPDGPVKGSGSGAAGVDLRRFEFTRPQMGVPFRLVLYAVGEREANVAAEAAFARVSALNGILSDYDPDSEINRLGHGTPVGQPAAVSAELWEMLVAAQSLAEASGGAFDVTVGPVVNLWRRARRRQELPAEHLLAEARTHVGWRHLKLDRRRRTVTFLVPDMRLDFGGIAKGYAADEALRVLRERGITRALAGAAGDIVVGEPPPGQRGWRVEVGASDLPGAPAPRTVWLRNAAVSTGGDTFQRLEAGGRRYSHIIDPRTGIGLTERVVVVVVAPRATTTDGLETALSVLGPKAGLRLARRYRGAEVLLLRAAEGGTVEVHETPGFGRLASQ